MTRELIPGIEIKSSVKGPRTYDGIFRIEYKTRSTINPHSLKMFIPYQEHMTEEDIFHLPLETKIGAIAYAVFDDEIYCRRFFPFGQNPARSEFFILIGKGIADRIQLLTARHLHKTYGSNGYIVTHHDPNDYRKKQLERLGIKPETFYTLDEYLKTIESNVRLPSRTSQ